MPEPERHTPASAPRPVQAGLGVEDIRHIPVQKRELRFTRPRRLFPPSSAWPLGAAA